NAYGWNKIALAESGGSFDKISAHAVGNRIGFAEIAYRHDSSKFFAANAAEQNLRPERRCRGCSKHLQHPIPNGMPQPIVDVLEPVEIKQDDRKGLTVDCVPAKAATAPSRKARRLATPLKGSTSELILCCSSVRSFVMLRSRNDMTTVKRRVPKAIKAKESPLTNDPLSKNGISEVAGICASRTAA